MTITFQPMKTDFTTDSASVPSASATLSVRIPATLAARLDRLTQATGRNKSAIAVEALKEYILAEAWQIEEIQKGIQEANRGEFASPEAVDAFFAQYGC